MNSKIYFKTNTRANSSTNTVTNTRKSSTQASLNQSTNVQSNYDFSAIDPLTKNCKRSFDIAVALLALIITLPLFPLIALAIALESKGDIFFKQMRIGLATPQFTHIFYMIKFRTMRQDAEKASGAVWAGKNDPRITRVGKFLRKTRLDELPQLFNVLRGDMSLIGPRPERPGFYQKLESNIPYFAERTFNVMPGITGLAQVNQGYDTCLDDVRRKVGFDHSYAMALTRPLDWLRMDCWIALSTVKVMILGRGQ
ncbi:sugar transferase [Saccharobesus litoralis]|uniref:Sugar transferase n=1 Tax=Saccharobesus litoralis TaxID=2172099 RepID=A0A2S0VMP0_9ALTE|nr:sugar transferase [Saccharobesus litoralis]AWB65370.1 sugar transferase [Saccharobesus litoralis]